MKRVVTVLLAALAVAVPAQAAPDPESLLRELRQAQQQSQEINSERERRFLENKQEQARMLREARAELAPVEQRTGELRARYDSLREDLRALEKKLSEEAGDLNQMVAVVRQAAGDLQAVAGDSLITAQYPERESELASLAASDSVPTTGELEDLWYLLQQEMTATGNVVRFRAPVVSPDGSRREREVVRVGPFVAVTGDTFLQYLPGTGLKALARQPGGGAREMAAGLSAAEPGSGVHPMVIDPTRGSVLELLVQRPGVIERIRQGGGVGAVIIVIGLAGLAIALWQGLRLVSVGRRVRRQLKQVDRPSPDNPLGRVRAAGREAGVDDPESLELKVDEAVMREVPGLQRAQPLIKLLAAVAPLLGLLGTVVGMIATFQAITLFGTGDPKMMAGGISQALMTTVMGLIVAIPLLFAHSVLAARSRAVIQVLEEQSSGLLARAAERSGGGGHA